MIFTLDGKRLSASVLSLGLHNRVVRLRSYALPGGMPAPDFTAMHKNDLMAEAKSLGVHTRQEITKADGTKHRTWRPTGRRRLCHVICQLVGQGGPGPTPGSRQEAASLGPAEVSQELGGLSRAPFLSRGYFWGRYFAACTCMWGRELCLATDYRGQSLTA